MRQKHSKRGSAISDCLVNVVHATGDGQFGKVYAAVNMETGELMALKEVHVRTNISKYLYYVCF